MHSCHRAVLWRNSVPLELGLKLSSETVLTKQSKLTEVSQERDPFVLVLIDGDGMIVGIRTPLWECPSPDKTQ